nr:hypothetical protein [uncultured Desulfobulbus sp.]
MQNGRIALNAMEREICAKMGLTEGEFLNVEASTSDKPATTALNAIEQEVCAKMGLTEEEYLKTAI